MHRQRAFYKVVRSADTAFSELPINPFCCNLFIAVKMLSRFPAMLLRDPAGKESPKADWQTTGLPRASLQGFRCFSPPPAIRNSSYHRCFVFADLGIQAIRASGLSLNTRNCDSSASQVLPMHQLLRPPLVLWQQLMVQVEAWGPCALPELRKASQLCCADILLLHEPQPCSVLLSGSCLCCTCPWWEFPTHERQIEIPPVAVVPLGPTLTVLVCTTCKNGCESRRN